MYYTPATSTLRYVLPRAELRATDRRSGAYPTKARTGDRSRTGKNKFYFDDTRSIVFANDVEISLPTTFQTGSGHLSEDLTSSFTTIGNVNSVAINQWIEHREQVESYQPFIEDKLFDQDENAVTNSRFMTGAANFIAPERFRSKLSNKTIIRLDFPITSSKSLGTSSSMHYLNVKNNSFDLVRNEQALLTEYYESGVGDFFSPMSPDAVLFTPYGYAYTPPNINSTSTKQAQELLFNIANYTPNGSEAFLFPAGFSFTRTSSSLINDLHRATSSQLIALTSTLAHPFLLEKVCLEFNIEAGPEWMNDAFSTRVFMYNPNNLSIERQADMGGPMVTVGLLRQDSTDKQRRDLIASATFTNAFDAMTASYIQNSCSADLVGVIRTDFVYTRTGLSGCVDPNFVVYGSVISGSENYYTGTVRLTMEPAVTHHLMRSRLSGSTYYTYFLGSSTRSARSTDAKLLSFGPISRRPGLYSPARQPLGNSITLVDVDDVNGTINPVKTYESDHDNLESVPNTFNSKAYIDVIAKHRPSPYLLYPQDKLILCVSKHRSVFSSQSAGGDYVHAAYHDIKIATGTLRLTLYGDLIKEDREFHDTLNQRLETVELWETIGEEPVLDQFDVVYNSELSGSYLDRFSVLKALSPIKTDFSGSRFTDRYYSNFVDDPVSNTSWSEQLDWSKTKKIHEIQKSSRVATHVASNEIFWDTRIPNPKECMTICNPNFRVSLHSDGRFIWTGPDYLYISFTDSGSGIFDWGMTYPYESRYSKVTQQFSNTLTSEIFRLTNNKLERITYDFLSMEVGQVGSGFYERYHGSEWLASSSTLTGLKLAEFIKMFFGIGNGVSSIDNQYVKFRNFRSVAGDVFGVGADIRGWRYGMMSGYPVANVAVFRRDRYGQFRDMFEQRVDAKFYSIEDGTKESVVQVKFYDAKGKLTDPIKTLSSNLSYEATSSVPYTDNVARNRPDFDITNLNIKTVTFSP